MTSIVLENELNRLCDEQLFHTGWYVKNLRTGTVLERYGSVVVPSGSRAASSSNDAWSVEISEASITDRFFI